MQPSASGAFTLARRGERDAGLEHCPARGRADDVHCSVECADAVAQAVEPAGFGPVPGSADPVVTHLNSTPVVLKLHPHPGGCGAGVLDNVRQGFGAEEVYARLDRAGEPAVGHVDLDGDRQPGGEGADGRGETPLGEDGGMDPRGDLAQVLDPAPGVAEGQASSSLARCGAVSHFCSATWRLMMVVTSR